MMEVIKVDVKGMHKAGVDHGRGGAGRVATMTTCFGMAPGAPARRAHARCHARENLLDAIDMYPDDFSDEVIEALEAAEDAALSSGTVRHHARSGRR